MRKAIPSPKSEVTSIANEKTFQLITHTIYDFLSSRIVAKDASGWLIPDVIVTAF
jgi:hypothetical protein